MDFTTFINWLNGIVWSPALVCLLLGGGLYFSIRTRFVQLRMMHEMVRLIFQPKDDDLGISSFQALSMTLAGRVGTGNIAGVATAIMFGGPGALFWMWVVAILGAASAFVESTLGQVYKEEIYHQVRGGPAYYIEKGLNNKVFAWIFALFTIFSCGLFLPSIQSNSIALSAQMAFGIEPLITAVVITSLLSFIIYGGLKRMATFVSWVVPFMAQAYVVVAIIIIFVHWERFDDVLALIFTSAFDMEAAGGAMIGLAIQWGVKRGLYSNEAGQGSGPHASSAAAVSHPAKQGLVQAFSVYIDTLLVCSATGFMILMTGCYNVVSPQGGFLYQALPNVEAGPAFTQFAADSLLPGFGAPFVSVALFFFAFTTILAYVYITETNVVYINRHFKKPWLIPVLRVLVMIPTAYGAVKSAELVWTMGDIGMGIMAWMNMFAILALQGVAFKCLKDYENQRKQGIKNPVFHPEKLGIKNAHFWTSNRAEMTEADAQRESEVIFENQRPRNL